VKVRGDVKLIKKLLATPEHRTPNTEHRTPNTEHRTPNTEHRTPNTKPRTPNTETIGLWPMFI
jgi:hypothetical protein